MNQEEENDIIFETDIDQSDEECVGHDIEQREVYYQPADDRVINLYRSWKNGELIVQPDFQRLYVWDAQKATSLIESALIGIPLPVIYLFEEDRIRKSVIDGQQRLTAFFSFLDGTFPDGSEFKLRKMQVFPELKGKLFSQLDREYRKRIEECSIRTVTFLKNSDPELKFNVFERLNTGAVALNDQELRNCIYHGAYNKLLKELASDPDFKYILGIEGKERRMQDVELVLRFCAFLNKTYLNYKPPMRSFLNEEMRENRFLTKEKADKIRAAFKNTVSLIKSMRGEKAFRRYNVGTQDKTAGDWEPKKFSASLYDVLMFGFADKDKNLVMRNLDAINEAYVDLMSNDKVFCESIERSTSSQQAVRKRFDIWRMTLDSILDEDSKQPRCFSKALKQRLFEKNPTCEICGQEIKTIDDAAIDHIEQYWRGGQTIPENARLAHRYCNCHRNRND
ncbi:MAG: DUF262 domain-containing protein [Lentisphaeria bacterium]|nr:DUF262 domain-containing protein [Lentisphaeria bacterium]